MGNWSVCGNVRAYMGVNMCYQEMCMCVWACMPWRVWGDVSMCVHIWVYSNRVWCMNAFFTVKKTKKKTKKLSITKSKLLTVAVVRTTHCMLHLQTRLSGRCNLFTVIARRRKNFLLLRSLMEEDDRVNVSNHRHVATYRKLRKVSSRVLKKKTKKKSEKEKERKERNEAKKVLLSSWKKMIVLKTQRVIAEVRMQWCTHVVLLESPTVMFAVIHDKQATATDHAPPSA